MSANTDSHTRRAVKADPWTHGVWREYIEDSMASDGRGWLACLRFAEAQ